MLSLRQILARHPSLLLIDSSSSLIQVGLFLADRAPTWESLETDAGSGIFAATETLLKRTNAAFISIDAFAFCAGPGSVLGIRTAAVAVRTWNVIRERPVFSFSGLELVAHAQKINRMGRNFSVIADARRATWHRVMVNTDGAMQPLHRVSATELAGDLMMPTTFRHWTPLPPGIERVPYFVSQMLAELGETSLFSENSDPDAFLHEAPDYLTWTPRIHRAPTSP